MGRKKKLTPEEITELSAKGLDLLSDLDASCAAGGRTGMLVSSDEVMHAVVGTTEGRVRTIHCRSLDSDGDEGDYISSDCGVLSVSAGEGGSIISSSTVSAPITSSISAPTWMDSMWSTTSISTPPFLSDERSLTFVSGSEKYSIKLDYNGAPIEMTAGQIYETLKLVTEWIGTYAPIRFGVTADRYPEMLVWIMTNLIRNTAEKCIAIIRKHQDDAGTITPGCANTLVNAIIKELVQPAADRCSDLENTI